MPHSSRTVSPAALRPLPGDERHRLALELHDSTAQALAALATALDLIDQRAGPSLDPRVRGMLDESRQLARQCFDDVLRLIDTVAPHLVDRIDPPSTAERKYRRSRTQHG